MRLGALVSMVLQSIRSHPKDFLHSCVGMVVSVAMLSFALSLGAGVRENVVDVVFPIDLLEVEPIAQLGTVSSDRPDGFVKEDLPAFEKIRGVRQVYPKQKALFKARMWGGAGLLGKNLNSEAFFDGVEPGLVADDLAAAQEQMSQRQNRRKIPCMNDGECFAGMLCKEGACENVSLSSRFASFDVYHPCDLDEQCAEGYTCLGHRCREKACDFSVNSCDKEETCVAIPCTASDECGSDSASCVGGYCSVGACSPVCEASPGGGIPARGSCELESWCVPRNCGDDTQCGEGQCKGGQCDNDRVCAPIPCGVDTLKDMTGDDEELARGHVRGVCADGSRPVEDEPCDLPLPCPSGSICSTSSSVSLAGYCERPIPVLFNPLLVELLGSASVATGGVSLSEENALLGIRFRVEAGASYVKRKSGLPKEQRRTLRCEVVAMSDVPPLFGGTVPLPVVQGLNARYGKGGTSGNFQSIVLAVEDGEKLQDVLDSAAGLGAQPGGASAIANQVGAVVFWMTLVFFVLGFVILVLSAVNIGHTMLMIVHQRRREVGVMRCIGARRQDIRRMFLGEAALTGLAGAAAGLVLTYAVSLVLDHVIALFLDYAPFVPESFFIFDPFYMALIVGLGVFFSVIGSWVPALAASRIEPAILVRES